MVMQSSTLKKLLFGIVLCVVPMGLFGMTAHKNRVRSARNSAKVTPIDEEVVPYQAIPSKAFQAVAAAAAKMDRPDSPHFPMDPQNTKKIEEWVEKSPCVTKPSVSFDKNIVDLGRKCSASAPVSGRETPMQAFSNGKMSSSSSQSSYLSQMSSVEDRLWSLERVVEDASLEATDSVVRYHEKLNNLLNLSEDGSNNLRALYCRQQCVQEKLTTLQQQLSDSTAALKVQKEATEALTTNLKEKDENIVDMKQTVNTLVTQVVLLQKIMQQQQRPWWKRCFGSCSKRSDVDEDGSVKTLIFPMRVCDDSVQTDPIAQ